MVVDSGIGETIFVTFIRELQLHSCGYNRRCQNHHYILKRSPEHSPVNKAIEQNWFHPFFHSKLILFQTFKTSEKSKNKRKNCQCCIENGATLYFISKYVSYCLVLSFVCRKSFELSLTQKTDRQCMLILESCKKSKGKQTSKAVSILEKLQTTS